ncbi:MAG: MBL fold metallo-hydrolase [Rubrobacteraceae bacterium]
MRIETMDLNFMETEQVLASYLLLGEGSAALVETGPTTCLDSLMGGLKEHGVSEEDVRQVFVTHIHLDHAGASGNLSELLPNATFYVHEVGYPHLVDPSRLVKSATRIFGEDRMEGLWGEVRPVPEERLVKLEGGEEIEAADGVLSAHYTPGHAYHHLAFYEAESGTLLAGDVAGIRRPGQSYVMPPTPAPEVDIEAWKGSIETMRGLSPKRVCPTHFGSYEDVERHLSELELRLQEWLLFVEERMDAGLSKQDIVEEFGAMNDAELLREGSDPEESEGYQVTGDYEVQVTGLMHHVSRQREMLDRR